MNPASTVLMENTPLVFTHLWAAVAVSLIVFFGAIVQSGLGMGFGLTVAPVLALIDPLMVPAAALFLGMATAIASAVREHTRIAWSQVGMGMVGRTTGIACGGFALVWLTDRSLFDLVFGSLIMVAVILSVLGLRLALNTRNLLSMGWVSGFTGIITSVGAPPLALIYQGEDPATARPTLGAFFSFGGLISLLVLYAVGWAGWQSFVLALFMAPSAIAGTLAGRRMQGRFDARYRGLLLAIAALAAILLMVRGLSGQMG